VLVVFVRGGGQERADSFEILLSSKLAQARQGIERTAARDIKGGSRRGTNAVHQFVSQISDPVQKLGAAIRTQLVGRAGRGTHLKKKG